MKKIYSLCIITLVICTCSLKSNASRVIVNVEDFEFGPETFTINAGDTIIWMWDNSAGPHTTTSTVIPVGAVSWNQQINQNSPMFTYIPTIAGTYDYICSFHSSMGMVGHFTVLGSTGIAPIPIVTSFSLSVTNPVSNEVQIIYSIPKTSALSIRLYDIVGKAVSTLVSYSQNAGIYTETFAIPSLSRGIYIIYLETQYGSLSKQVLIQ